MPADLLEVTEVHSFNDSSFVNEKLATGDWVLLEVKVMQWSTWQKKSADHEAHLRTVYDTVYVIGKVN